MIDDFIQELQQHTDIAYLEAKGRQLTPSLFIKILDNILAHHLAKHKLPPLLVGLSSVVFTEALLKLSTEQLDLIKQEIALEPVQHQVTASVYTCREMYDQLLKQVNAYTDVLNKIVVTQLNQHDINQLFQQLNHLQQTCESLLNLLGAILALAWHAERSDIVNLLSQIKEQILHLKAEIGSATYPTTGLYHQLERTLESVFKFFLDPTTPSLEGLTAFSIWYVKDYQDVGLLSSVENITDLDQHSLMHHVQQELNYKGLATITDLIKARIFSKAILKDYLIHH